MIHRTSPLLLLRASPSPFRRASSRPLSRSSCVLLALPLTLCGLPFRRYPRGPFTIALPAVSSFLVTFFAHFHRFPALFRLFSLSARSGEFVVVVETVLPGRRAPEDFIAAALSLPSVRRTCPRAPHHCERNDVFYSNSVIRRMCM